MGATSWNDVGSTRTGIPCRTIWLAGRGAPLLCGWKTGGRLRFNTAKVVESSLWSSISVLFNSRDNHISYEGWYIDWKQSLEVAQYQCLDMAWDIIGSRTIYTVTLSSHVSGVSKCLLFLRRHQWHTKKCARSHCRRVIITYTRLEYIYHRIPVLVNL